MLNPNLDPQELAEQFRRDDRVRITDILQKDVAERIAEHCEQHVPYEYICHLDGKNLVMTPEQLTSLNPQQQQEMQEKLVAQAGEGVGFFYCGYMLGRAQSDTDDEKVRFLHTVFDYLNSDEMLSFISTITNRDDIRGADAQFTRYTAGQFLTRHSDDIVAEGRRVAYVLSFCRDWHPDWGGLLQFYEHDGTPRDAWLPGFNTISLFDVRHIHSVTYVTPFARRPRLSIAGWFNTVEGGVVR